MDDLVGLIYETVAQPDLWSEVTARLKAAFAAQALWMFYPTLTGADFVVLDGISMSLRTDYATYYHKVDITLQAALRDPAALVNRVVRERDLVGEAAWLGSEVYHDLALPNGIAQIMSAKLESAPTAAGPFLSFFRAPDAPLFDDAVMQSYSRILPHLQRAVRLQQRFDAGPQPLHGWSLTMLDQLSAGLFLLDGEGRLIHANTVGRAMLASRDGLLLNHGRLGAVERAAADRLDGILRACTTGRRVAGEMRVPRARGHWLLSACPLSHAATMFNGVGQCRAWAWVSDPGAERPDLQRRLQVIFGLTPAEQRIAAAMLTGLTSAEIADRHGVSLATVRSQVQSIFGRLGVRRQSDMIRLVAEVSALPGGTAGCGP
jgi:DNA-binding CsgD family transcriptional regulator